MKDSSWRSSRRNARTRRSKRCERSPGGESACIIGEIARTAGGAVLVTTRIRRHTHRRHAGRRSAPADLLRHAHDCSDANSPRSRRAAFARTQHSFETFFAQRIAYGLPRHAARCRNGFSAVDACWLSARALCNRRAACVGGVRSSGDRGKRALPALDLSLLFLPWLRSALLQPEDIVMGFGPPEGDPEIESALEDGTAPRRDDICTPRPSNADGVLRAAQSGIQCLHAPGVDRDSLSHALGDCACFLRASRTGARRGRGRISYPFLGQDKQETHGILDQVAESIRIKVQEDANLRAQVAAEQAERITNAALAMAERVSRGGKLILFGNGGSATDANDWAIDCVAPPDGYRPIPAVSLSFEPANISALANDVGTDVIFLRQLIAQARPGDVAVGISTSGGSKNVDPSP